MLGLLMIWWGHSDLGRDVDSSWPTDLWSPSVPVAWEAPSSDEYEICCYIRPPSQPSTSGTWTGSRPTRSAPPASCITQPSYQRTHVEIAPPHNAIIENTIRLAIFCLPITIHGILCRNK